MFKVERALTGLFKAFKLQSQGNLPYLMQEQVQPTLDLNLWAFHAIGAEVTQTLAPTVLAAPGLIGSYTQADDWLVIGATCQAIAGGVGDLALTTISWQAGNGTATHLLANVNKWGALGAMTSLAAGELISTSLVNFQQPFFSPAGAVWTYVGTNVVASTGPIVDASVLHYKLARS